MNKVILIGRLSKDPEVRKTTTNKSVCNFSLAVSDTRQKDKAFFFNCSAWEKQADFISTYLLKGALVAVEGRLTTRAFVGKDGKNNTVTEIVVENIQSLGTKSDSNTTNVSKRNTQLVDLNEAFEDPKTVNTNSREKITFEEEVNPKNDMDWLEEF